ncbi:hypothetical protein DPMN_087370 [Dreissena polymorpha]|uniref:Uncharacterized protein n=1 Tax=Dreissena polymorpha TaxID=45954 RepID=A0A9D4QVJ0_DREPO|nr:hypothetical protein DPMN_087370 [Dreissena polymorpha]
MARFGTWPVTQCLLKVRHSDCAGKPLQPTSTGKHHAFQPFSVQVSVRAWYCVFSCKAFLEPLLPWYCELHHHNLF